MFLGVDISIAIGLFFVFAWALVWLGMQVLLQSTEDGKPLPPFVFATFAEGFLSESAQKGLHKLECVRDYFSNYPNGVKGGSSRGATIRLAVPRWKPHILTSDYLLGRIVLLGQPATGTHVAEKFEDVKAGNLWNPKDYNISTKKTADEKREKTRKFIAHSFSTTNLLKTWPPMQNAMMELIAELQKFAARGAVFDLKKVVVRFFVLHSINRFIWCSVHSRWN